MVGIDRIAKLLDLAHSVAALEYPDYEGYYEEKDSIDAWGLLQVRKTFSPFGASWRAVIMFRHDCSCCEPGAIPSISNRGGGDSHAGDQIDCKKNPTP
jgi:hypothetical protein